MRRRALLGVAGLLLAGCTTSTAGGEFDFVSPGGQTLIRYDVSERSAIGELAGEDLLDPSITRAVSDYPGEVVVLNVWGQWCGPCRAEADDLEQVAQASEADGVQFLGINVRDPNRSAAQDFVRDRDVSYPSIYDPTYRTLLALGGDYPTSATPSTIVLDREHRVAAIFLVGLLASDLQPVVDEVAAES